MYIHYIKRVIVKQRIYCFVAEIRWTQERFLPVILLSLQMYKEINYSCLKSDDIPVLVPVIIS